MQESGPGRACPAREALRHARGFPERRCKTCSVAQQPRGHWAGAPCTSAHTLDASAPARDAMRDRHRLQPDLAPPRLAQLRIALTLSRAPVQ